MTEPLRILILEDNPADAELVQFELQDAGLVFTSQVVMTENAYVHAIQDYCPDLILSDYDLPKYNGALALAEARSRCPDTPFILVTGAVTEDRAIDILTQGAKDYVLKHRLNQRLVPAVRRALTEAEEHRARRAAEEELRKTHAELETRVKERTAALEAEVEGHKRTEAALRLSERRLSEVLESMPDAFVSFDSDMRYTYVNANAERLQAKRREELIGRDVRGVYSDAESYKTISQYERVVREQKPITLTSYHAGFDGWVKVRAFPTPEGVSVFYTNVSAAVEAERALRESEERLRLMGDNLPDSALYQYAHEPDGTVRFLYVSQGIERLNGVKAQDVLRDPLALHGQIPPEYLEQLEQSEKRSASDLSDFDMVVPMRRTDGEIRWMRLHSRPRKTPDGRTIWDGVQIDVTERKQAEAEIAQLASFPMLNPNPVLEVDLAGVIHFANPAAERLFPDLLRRKLKHPFLADWEATARTFRAEGLLENSRELNIHGRWYMQTLYLVEETQRIRIYAHDITLRKEAEKELMKRAAELEDINKDLESFSYYVSHDLRAPLRAITGYSQMILKKQAAQFDEETRRRFQMITDNAEKMGLLIEDLLAFSRLGSQDVATINLDMEELAGEVWQELVTIHPCREMTLRISQMPAACGDKALIRQVYGNLLGNAVKFTQGRNPAIVEAGSCIQDGEGVYYVRDNGVGFDMRFYDNLFGVFQRLHRDEEHQGTGIGLALVKRIINRHGGRVWAEGRVDEGATFYFSLPTRKE